MNIFKAFDDFLGLARTAFAILRLPQARLYFLTSINPECVRSVYQAFTRPHNRFPLIKNKTLGIALIDLRKFKCPDEYLDTVKKKDYAAYHRKQALKRGYSARQIDRNDYIEEIHQINISTEYRQGRPMDAGYRIRQTHFASGPPYWSYGVFNAQNQLVAYCSIGIFGNFAATDQLLGYKNGDGTMYLLLSEIICLLISDGRREYFMYDTFLGALPGLKKFKRRVGFAAYRVRYEMY